MRNTKAALERDWELRGVRPGAIIGRNLGNLLLSDRNIIATRLELRNPVAESQDGQTFPNNPKKSNWLRPSPSELASFFHKHFLVSKEQNS
jgi:hypothetical protein